MSRISRQDLYMGIAELFSQRSTCGRLRVGATLIRDGRIICSGYNGPIDKSMASGTCHCDLSKPCEKSIHAEANLIAYAARNGIATQGSTLYVTHSPCPKCAELIIQAGISQVIFRNIFRDQSGLALLKAHSIITHFHEPQKQV